MIIKRGEIHLASLDPAAGREISKTRPVVIISNDMNNRFSGTVTVLPITSKNLGKVYPFEVRLPKSAGNLPKDSKVKADQIRTLDKRRIIKAIGMLDTESIARIETALKIHLGLEIPIDNNPVDTVTNNATILDMIKSFKHKGLAELFEKGDSRKVRQDLQSRSLRRLEALDQTESLTDLNVPGFNFHGLQGGTETLQHSCQWPMEHYL
jgi:mRNA interferase MazF